MTDYKAKEQSLIVARALRGVVNTVEKGRKRATLVSLIDQSAPLSLEGRQEFNRIISNHREFQEVRMLESIEEMGIEKGKMLGQLESIRGLLKNGIGWDVIEKATGIKKREYKKLRAHYLPEK